MPHKPSYGTDYDGFQFFPDIPDGQMIALGTPVRALVRFAQDGWLAVHSQKITVGMSFEIRAGAKAVGRGRVTKVRWHIPRLGQPPTANRQPPAPASLPPYTWPVFVVN